MLYLSCEKNENKQKRGRGWPIYKKQLEPPDRRNLTDVCGPDGDETKPRNLPIVGDHQKLVQKFFNNLTYGWKNHWPIL